jgi:hypothetical protein
MKTNTRKSLIAVAAGVLAIILVTTVVDVVLHLVGVYPSVGQPLSDALAVVASAYRLAISVGGAYLAAWLAPERPLRHAVMLGWVGVVLGLVGLVATWSADLGPRWYPVSLVVLALPQCWLGGKLYELRSRRVTA